MNSAWLNEAWLGDATSGNNSGNNSTVVSRTVGSQKTHEDGSRPEKAKNTTIDIERSFQRGEFCLQRGERPLLSAGTRGVKNNMLLIGFGQGFSSPYNINALGDHKLSEWRPEAAIFYQLFHRVLYTNAAKLATEMINKLLDTELTAEQSSTALSLSCSPYRSLLSARAVQKDFAGRLFLELLHGHAAGAEVLPRTEEDCDDPGSEANSDLGGHERSGKMAGGTNGGPPPRIIFLRRSVKKRTLQNFEQLTAYYWRHKHRIFPTANPPPEVHFVDLAKVVSLRSVITLL